MQSALADLSRQLKNHRMRLQVLHDISSILSDSWNIQQVFPAISARLRRVLQQEYAGFEVHDSGSGLLVRHVDDFPLSRGHLDTVQISSQNSPGGRALELGRPILFSGEQLAQFDAEIARRFVAEGFRSLCCVPLVRPKGPLGVFVLGSTRDNAFRPEDFELLNQVAFLLGTALENQRAQAEIQALKQRLTHERQYLEGEVRSKGEFSEIVGESHALRQVLEQVATVAPSSATVLVQGETGTGKELIARALHRMSRNREAAFVKLNCAAIPTGLLESELFGHEKGAFTGAVSQKIGRLELADGGSLFLDEVGEIPLELQPKLLRVLQDQEFERLGSTRTIRVNVRLVAATNRDLVRSVAEHQFRNDLFYRLNVFPIHIPPLRERPEDIPLLVRYFVRKFAQRMDRHIETIPKETMAALIKWHWPGNIRELENLMERSVILSTGRALHVPPLEQLQNTPDSPIQPDERLSSVEREHIIRVLRESGGAISGRDGAAHRLGVKRTTLQSKMQRLGITREEYLPPKKQ
jgi:formate hydrogenlyase transcriptional activator